MSKIYKEPCPCKDCKLRKADCHSTCKEYKKWKESGVEIQKEYFVDFKRRYNK